MLNSTKTGFSIWKTWMPMLFAAIAVVALIVCAQGASSAVCPAGAEPAVAEASLVCESAEISLPVVEPATDEPLSEDDSSVAEAAAAEQTGLLSRLSEDLSGLNLNNTDPRAVALANFFAGYDGQFVFFGNWGNRRSGSFGRLMGLYGNDKYNTEILKHEHGHYEQYKQLGFWKYVFAIAIPSLTHDPAADYYSQLWEVTADILGGVTSQRHAPGAEEAGRKYLDLIKDNNVLVSVLCCLIF